MEWLGRGPNLVNILAPQFEEPEQGMRLKSVTGNRVFSINVGIPVCITHPMTTKIWFKLVKEKRKKLFFLVGGLIVP